MFDLAHELGVFISPEIHSTTPGVKSPHYRKGGLTCGTPRFVTGREFAQLLPTPVVLMPMTDLSSTRDLDPGHSTAWCGGSALKSRLSAFAAFVII